jgi:hypothetical protein
MALAELSRGADWRKLWASRAPLDADRVTLQRSSHQEFGQLIAPTCPKQPRSKKQPAAARPVPSGSRARANTPLVGRDRRPCEEHVCGLVSCGRQSRTEHPTDRPRSLDGPGSSSECAAERAPMRPLSAPG